MVAFATVEDVEARLGRSFDESQTAQVQVLLDDASAYLRGIIGAQVYPPATVTFTGHPSGGRLDLPAQPVTSVTSVEREGQPVEYSRRPGFLVVCGDGPVDVTFSYGYAVAPDDLKRVCCVLVAQTLTTLTAGLGLGVGGVSSVAVDDFKIAWADGGAGAGMTVPENVAASLRDQFGMPSGTTVGVHS